MRISLVLSALLFIYPHFISHIAAQEPLIVGKEGLRYHYKNLFRRSHDNYTQYIIEGSEQIRIQQKPALAASDQPQFIPEFSRKADLLSDFRRYDANDFVELFFEMEDFPAHADTLYILNRLLQMKTMTGIKYFSTRQQEMTTYITSCYIVAEPSSRKEVPPPQFRELPTEPIRLIVFQDDNRFTPTWYSVVIRVGADGSLRMTMNNITPMYVQFIFYFKAIDALKVRHEIVILPAISAQDKPVIYALSQIHNERAQVLGIKLDLGNSFNRRMSAVQGWISGLIYEPF
ncbi:MAG: DUF6675 family protein [Spirochaetota bacterium]